MNAGQLQTLKELIEFLKQQGVGGFELEQEGLKVRLRFGSKERSAEDVDVGQIAQLLQQAPKASAAPAASVAAPVASMQANDAAAATGATSEEAGLHIIKSPIVGTFYEAPAPGADPFVKVGDKVEAGQIICIVEAMKLMNEIECDAPGEVVKRLVVTGQPVEYGQPLFHIRPR